MNTFAACEYMKERFDIPYVKGLPWNGKVQDYMDVDRKASKKYIVGETVISGSVAAYLKETTGEDYNVIASTEITDGLLLDCDKRCHGEEEIEEALKDAEVIIADPMVKYISPASAKFIELPHFADHGSLRHAYSRDIQTGNKKLLIAQDQSHLRTRMPRVRNTRFLYR